MVKGDSYPRNTSSLLLASTYPSKVTPAGVCPWLVGPFSLSQMPEGHVNLAIPSYVGLEGFKAPVWLSGTESICVETGQVKGQHALE